jgi:hypothetical protein
MYFAEDTVTNELKCSFCLKTFENPRLLPCGDMSCLKCIINEFDEDKKFKCADCEMIHMTLDPSDYLISKRINNLLMKMRTKMPNKFIKHDFPDEQ